jgi:protein-tyrosine phosphatase
MNDLKAIKVLFVCMGNICRSPTAHGIFQSMVDRDHLGGLIEVDSAGTHSYHVDSPPDLRSQATARDRGIDLAGLRARRFTSDDFVEYDYLLGMDHSNIDDMLRLKPENARAQVDLMLTYSRKYAQAEVPDPYFGNDGFELVFDMIEDAAQGLLAEIRSRHGI